jgi:murein L,D-transpeptidase YcbB/YkuD
LLEWVKANLTPDQNQRLGMLLSAAKLAKGYLDIADVCSTLQGELTPQQMIDVVTAVPALAQCNPPAEQPGEGGAPEASPVPGPDTPVDPNAVPGQPAPPPDQPGGQQGGGGGPGPVNPPAPGPQVDVGPAVIDGPRTAAMQLADYLARTNDFGTKAKPSAAVKDYQKAMGSLTADGIVGSKTRARAKALGVTLPQPGNPAKTAAAALRDYLASTGDFGSKAKPSAKVKAYQKTMGGLTADGIVGPKTIARAKALGVTLPTAPGSTSSSTTTAKSSQQQAAQDLATYLSSGGDYGSKAKPSARVKALQSAMGGLTADGIVGPKTIARAKALGVTLPAAGAKAPATKTATGTAAQAAADLKSYLERTGDFGSKAHPSETVKGYQKSLGVTADGIVGPKTRAAASSYGSILPMPGDTKTVATTSDMMKRPPSVVLAARSASAPASHGGATAGATGDLVPALTEQSFTPIAVALKDWAAKNITLAQEAQILKAFSDLAKARGAVDANKLPLSYDAVASVLSAKDACGIMLKVLGKAKMQTIFVVPTMRARLSLACEGELEMPDGFPKAVWDAASQAQRVQIILNFVPGVSVVTPQKPATTTKPAQGSNAQMAAAQQLSIYLANTNDFGAKGKPSASVKGFQTQMGGLTADGIVGPKTRARAQALGVILPQPSAAPAQTSSGAKAAAATLRDYLAKTNDFGSTAHPSQSVKVAQQAMGGIAADGIVGPKTRARAQALGVTLPQPGTPPASVQSQAAAAASLRDYLARTNDFGSKAKPSATVKQLQTAMGGLTADGIVGPKTNARAAALGVTLPLPTGHAVTAPAAPAAKPISPSTAAAQQLRDYLTSTHDFGSKAKPSATVKKLQAQMGGLTADGIVGPKTRARASALGVTLPNVVTATSGYDPGEARRLARVVVQDLRQHGRGYNRGLVRGFQVGAGIPPTGNYDAPTVAAVMYYGGKRAPRPMVEPLGEFIYMPYSG